MIKLLFLKILSTLEWRTKLSAPPLFIVFWGCWKTRKKIRKSWNKIKLQLKWEENKMEISNILVGKQCETVKLGHGLIMHVNSNMVRCTWSIFGKLEVADWKIKEGNKVGTLIGKPRLIAWYKLLELEIKSLDG